MIRALMSSASGMKAQQLNVDTVANNLANVNTTGFKKSQAMFQDLLYENIRAPGGKTGTDTNVPAGVQIGLGTRLVSVAKVFTPGKLQVTNRDLDVAIEGSGFFRILMPDGTNSYSRDGSFSKDDQGRIVTSDGYLLDGAPTLSPNATSVTISKSGGISETVDGTTQEIGQINLYRFVNPSGLLSLGSNLVQPTGASGEAEEGAPGQDGFGTMQQGVLETSNVEVVDEMVNLIIAQRAYEVNTKAVQASDEMLQSTNNMKR
jgi:flagellar basal-body rod protein FlgG